MNEFEILFIYVSMNGFVSVNTWTWGYTEKIKYDKKEIDYELKYE